MNLLFVIHTPKDPLTAVYKQTYERVTLLKNWGYRSDILSPEDFPSIRSLPPRLYPIIFPWLVALWLIHRENSYDVIVFHSYAGWAVNLLRPVIPSFRRIRIATEFHGLEPLYHRRLKAEMQRAGRPLRLCNRLLHRSVMLRLLRVSCRRSDLLLCRNSEEEAYLKNHFWMRRGEVKVIANHSSNDFFVSRRFAHRSNRLLFVGQWLEMKGTRYLVEAFDQLCRETPDLELCCVGTLSSEDKVLGSFPSEVRGKVLVRPRVDSEQLLQCYKEAELFVFPTISEGFSVALLEAMTASLPIVATAVGAAQDLLQSGYNAILIPPQDPTALAEAVRALYQDCGKREWLGQNAQATALKFRPEIICREYADHLGDLLRNARGFKTPQGSEGSQSQWGAKR